jgi:predicted nucleotidyltransferase
MYLQRYCCIITDVDVSEPGRGLTSSLTVPLLRVLAARSSPASAAQIMRLVPYGTHAGVSRALERMTNGGVVLGEEIGGRVVYSLNFDHVLAPAVRVLLRARDELPRRLRAELTKWETEPVVSLLYGSAARLDGDEDSDIDVLLVHPALNGSSVRMRWASQVHHLRSEVQRWTGNHCQVTDRSRATIRRLARAGEPVVDEWLNDGVHLVGTPFADLLAEL